MEGLNKRRSVIKGQITKLLNYAKTCDHNTSYFEIKVRLDKLNEHYQEFVTVEDKIFKLDANAESDMAIVDDNYYEITAIFSRLMRNDITAPVTTQNDSVGTALNGSLSCPSSDYKLPRLSLPVFSGNSREWQSFFDIFKATVHDNTSLTPAQKFQYLKGQLRGTAEKLVRHFRVDDANYIEAFQKLVKRFDRKRHIVNEFIEFFVNQAVIKNSDAFSIAQLYDTCDEVVRGLKALDPQAEARDCWLIYLAEKKLDETTLQLWRQETSDVDFPKFSEFLDFLSKRINSLEGFNSHSRIPANYQQKYNVRKAHARTFHVTKSLPNCPLCVGQQHRLCDCVKFIQMNIVGRREFILRNGRCFNCLSDSHIVKACNSKKFCHQCKRKHHTLVHPIATDEAPQPASTSSAATHITYHTSNEAPYHESSVNNNLQSSPDAILPTALVEIQDTFSNWQSCRVLLDSASTKSYITEACMIRLGLPRKNARLNISTINGGQGGNSKGVSLLTVRSKVDSKFAMRINAYILPKITSNQPACFVTKKHRTHLNQLQLADSKFFEPGKIDLLIGCDWFFSLLTDGRVFHNEYSLIAQNTKLGWIVGGSIDITPTSSLCCMASTEPDVDRNLRMFWEVEEVQLINQYSTEEQLCLNHFDKHAVFENGKIIVSLPFKQGTPELGNSLNQALRRFTSLEHKLLKDEQLSKRYAEFLREYQSLGQMELVPSDEIHKPESQVFYLPHHPVFKEASSTTKIRVVFDASAKSQTGVSLNEKLMVGPTTQQSLFEILIRFRKHQFIFTADVEKMFRQIWMNKKDVDYQRIVWRSSPNVSIQHFRLLTVTYGTASAPFLATQSLQMLAKQNANAYPEASRIIQCDFYMDDLMSGASTIEEALMLQHDVNSILQQAGLHLRKWSANHEKLLNHIPPTDREFNIKEINEGTKMITVLGIQFNPLNDHFSFNATLPEQTSHTKRSLLSEASRIFDPMGLIAPVTVRIKIFFQQLWRDKLNWDDPLPAEINANWIELRNQLPDLRLIEIPRWLYTSKSVELCGFCDASEDAYAAVVYARSPSPSSISSSHQFSTNIIAAKTKVAPIKTLTIPKLELCSAVLLAKLLESIIKALDFVEVPRFHLWTDSTTVLDWLSNSPKKGNIFVANRVTQILNITTTRDWNHVPSSQNPADCASRGLSPKDLQSYAMWWFGPTFLQFEPLEAPSTSRKKPKPSAAVFSTTTSQPQQCKSVASDLISTIVERISKFNLIIRTFASLRRAAHNFKAKGTKGLRRIGPLTVEEMDDSLKSIIKHSQHTHFQNEIHLLTTNSSIHKNSKVFLFNPFLDLHGIMRVGGRLSNADVTYDVKHPIILHGSDRLTKLLVCELHHQNLHAGPTLLLSIIQQKYKITRCRNLIRHVIHTCLPCFRQKREFQQQLMGQLPPSRVNLGRPFLQTSIDYAGPYILKTFHKRSPQRFKAYLSVFTCMATKAVHLELASDLSSDTFLAALQRFQSRRGICSDIFTDNGTNFVGAANEKEYFRKVMMSNEVEGKMKNWATNQFTKWHFVPPASPHFNGLCEAAVKSVKFHLRRVIGDQVLTYEELYTLLTRIEAVLNSRPLCRLADDSTEALTPSHFIIGQPLTIEPEPDLKHLQLSHLSRWQLVTHMFQHLWRRWQGEYLTQLNSMSKWNNSSRNMEVDDLVIIRDDNVPPGQWPLGLITDIHVGPDNLVRVVSVKTRNTILKRPVTKLCLVPKF